VWGWVDGLVQRYAMKRIEGRCSLAASLEFDVAEFEASVDKDIAWFEKVLARVGKPVRLTVQEMRKRGYIVRETMTYDEDNGCFYHVEDGLLIATPADPEGNAIPEDAGPVERMALDDAELPAFIAHVNDILTDDITEGHLQ
jgi:hypothetical protein